MVDEKPVVLDLVPLGTAQMERAQINNTKFSGGIKDGGDFLPTLGLRGRQFRIKAGKGNETSLDNRTLDVILVTAREGVSKQYYEGAYVAGESKTPTCQSADGIRPDPSVVNKQSTTCATCRMNAWGSKINATTGAEGKACGDFKVLILAPPTLDAEKPLQLQLPAASLKNLGLFIKLLNHNGLAANEVVTQLKFTDDAFPKLDFKYVRNLTQDEVAQAHDLEKRDDVIATVKTPEHQEEAAGASQQPVVAANVQPIQTAVSGAQTGPRAEVVPPTPTAPDNPSDEVAGILSRWGATAKK